MLNNEKLEDQAMLIISNAGAARGAAFTALAEAKKGDFKAAGEKLEEAKKYSHDAHTAHSDLLLMDAEGEVPQVDLLLSHSQDHLMNAQLALELITELIELYETIKKQRE
jgi:PTS system cellobiose-specific IIA component